MADLHNNKAKALLAKAKAAAKRIKGEAIAKKKADIKVISKLISEPGATPLLHFKHDIDVTGSGEKGSITTCPQEIDGVVKRAWRRIYI